MRADEPADGGRDRLARLVREQARACGDLGSPFYAVLLDDAADDVLAGGPVGRVLAGHEDDPRDAALALRLFGGVHRLVLAGRAPALAEHYPSAGGDGDVRAAWRELLGVVEEHHGELVTALETPPQTNEVGRGAALLGGLLHVAAATRLPVRLVEIGASAGLNLRADRFRVEAAGHVAGDAGSPVRLPDAWAGTLPPLDAPLEVVERLGTDLAPVDPTTPDGRLLLTGFVWPDQVERLARLRAACDLAAAVPATVRRQGAADTAAQLRLVPGTVTVLWHSVMWQYVAAAEQAAVESALAALGAAARDDAPFARLALEPDADGEFLVTLQRWPGGDRRVLAAAHPHGLPTTWR